MEKLPNETLEHILRYLPLGDITRMRLVSHRFAIAAEETLLRIFRQSDDWRYRYLLEQNFPIMGILPRLAEARMKESKFTDQPVDVAVCKTDTGAYVVESDADIDETIVKVALYGVMIDENRLVYRCSEECEAGCVIKVKSRLANKETNRIILKHDHPFEGLCAIDMSRECIVTTDGPHEIWAPRAAELSPPNLKLWRLEEKLTDRPDAKINAQHLLISGKHILTGPKLKENALYNTDQLFNSAVVKESLSDERKTAESALIKQTKSNGLQFDYRIRGDYLVTFGYISDEDSPARQILAAHVTNLTNQETRIIDPCEKHQSLDGDEDEYIETCRWESYRELTVAGDRD